MLVFAAAGALAAVVTAWRTVVGYDGMLLEMLSLPGLGIVGVAGLAWFALGPFAAIGVVGFGLTILGWREERNLER